VAGVIDVVEVVACASREAVCPLAAVEDVVAVAADQHVGTAGAEESVVARSSVDAVVPCACADDVGGTRPEQGVVAGTGDEVLEIDEAFAGEIGKPRCEVNDVVVIQARRVEGIDPAAAIEGLGNEQLAQSGDDQVVAAATEIAAGPARDERVVSGVAVQDVVYIEIAG